MFDFEEITPIHEDKLGYYFPPQFIDDLENYLGLNRSKREGFIKEYLACSDDVKSQFIYECVGKKIYKEYPVSIENFIFEDDYMGSIYASEIFPLWVDLLKKVYPAPLCKKYNEVVLSTATRCGKTTVAVLSALYEIYLLSCMINPCQALGISSTATIDFILLSKDNPTASSQLGDKIHKGLTASPCLQDYIYPKLSFSNLDNKGTEISKYIRLKAGSSINPVTGTDLYFGVLDEANMPSPNIADAQLVATRKAMYDAMLDRKSATFDKAPEMSGMMWLMSSPRDIGDLIGERIQDIKEKRVKNVLILDGIPRWKARMTKFDKTFDFFLGSDTKDPGIVDLIGMNKEDLPEESVVQIPDMYWNDFQGSTVNLSIQEILGRRTVAESALFSSVAAFEKVFYKDNDIFEQDELFVNLNEDTKIEDYLINKNYFSKPNDPDCYRYIHLDIASKKDRFGLSSVYSNRVSYTAENGDKISVRKYYVDFCLGISAKGGNAVDILEVLKFVYGLKKKGYPLKKVTTDNHQGELARQIISKYNIATEYLSVESSPSPYYNLKNVILTGILEGYKNPLLTKELRGLRISKTKSKSKLNDRIEKGKGFTDDLSDSLAGALFSCSEDPNYKMSDLMIDSMLKDPEFMSINSNNLYNPNLYLDSFTGSQNTGSGVGSSNLGIGY